MNENYVTIHGDKWKYEDVTEQVKWAQKLNWKKQKWIQRAALVSKGKTSEFIGQKYNPEHTKFKKEGWTHDHCEICWWPIFESNNPEEGIAYTTDGHTWICTECYQQFINKNIA